MDDYIPEPGDIVEWTGVSGQGRDQGGLYLVVKQSSLGKEETFYLAVLSVPDKNDNVLKIGELLIYDRSIIGNHFNKMSSMEEIWTH